MQFYDTILVADDSAINLQVIKQHLIRLDFMGVSQFAVDGQECINLAKEVFK